MPVDTHNQKTEQRSTLLELILRLHGEFRRSLEPIRVTPLQAGVMLYLDRCTDARVTEAAQALRVRPPTMTDVLNDLVRKGWVTKRRSAQDARVFRLRLSRRGETVTRKIQGRISEMETTLTEHDGDRVGIPQLRNHFQ